MLAIVPRIGSTMARASQRLEQGLPERLEVAFIVIAVGASQVLLWPAALGAFAGCLVILTVGVLVHRPLARMPENTLNLASV